MQDGICGQIKNETAEQFKNMTKEMEDNMQRLTDKFTETQAANMTSEQRQQYIKETIKRDKEERENN